MRRYRPQQVVPLVLGLFVPALVASCLAFAASLESPALSLKDLAHEEPLLMSCAHEASSTGEPLWCADPDSPHCIPGAPSPDTREPWLGPVIALAGEAPAMPVRPWALSPTWPVPLLSELASYAPCQRLERPPRLS